MKNTKDLDNGEVVELLYSGRLNGLKSKTGDIYNGEYWYEFGVKWYYLEDSNGMPYESDEVPTEVIDLTKNVTFVIL